MASSQVINLLAIIIILLPFTGSYYILKRRKDLYPLLPGATFLVFSMLLSSLKWFVITEGFNFLSHLFLMISGILWLLGMIYVYFKKETKQSIKIDQKEMRR